MLNVLAGNFIGGAFLLVIRSVVARRRELDQKHKSHLGQLLILNCLFCFPGFIFYVQNYGNNIVWFGSDIPSAQDYALLSNFGIGRSEWVPIALSKFLFSNLIVLLLGTIIFGIDYALLRRYGIGARSEWTSWALRMAISVVGVLLSCAAYGDYQFLHRSLH